MTLIEADQEYTRVCKLTSTRIESIKIELKRLTDMQIYAKTTRALQFEDYWKESGVRTIYTTINAHKCKCGVTFIAMCKENVTCIDCFCTNLSVPSQQ